MKLPTLKIKSQLEAVTKELKRRDYSKKKRGKSDLRFKSKLFVLSQVMIISGCRLRTEAGRRMDSSSGRMALK